MDNNELIRISVTNWNEYQERHDRWNYRWFKLHSDFFSDARVFILSPLEKLVLLNTMCSQSKAGTGPFYYGYKQGADLLRAKEADIRNAIKKLLGLSLVTLEDSAVNAEISCIPQENGALLDKIDKIDKIDKTASAGKRLFDIWNTNRGVLPEATRLSSKRNQLAAARWRDEPREDYWIEVVKRLAESDFCQGKNDRGWKADFEFLLRAESHVKIMEGKYDNRSSSTEWKAVKI